MRHRHLSFPGLSAIATLLVLTLAACVKSPHVVQPPAVDPGFHEQKIGASARDLLSEKRFHSLTVEIQYMQGFRPEEETVTGLKDFLQQFLCKPGGIAVVLREVNATAKKKLSRNDALLIENRYRTKFAADDTIAVYFFISNGSHPDRKVLGMAYRNTSAVIYGGAIKKNAGPGHVLAKAELETAVILHEMGHLLNLGNAASPSASNRSRKEKHQHCQNKMCLMYWATETQDAAVIHRKGKIPQLDEHCRKLLLANGGSPEAAVQEKR
ncbi:MAG TPA: hypothetical protein VFL47_15490 [Flavisolibacter sp.]|nr:hypothetical protein [Flavisolibacter sp.]